MDRIATGAGAVIAAAIDMKFIRSIMAPRIQYTSPLIFHALWCLYIIPNNVSRLYCHSHFPSFGSPHFHLWFYWDFCRLWRSNDKIVMTKKMCGTKNHTPKCERASVKMTSNPINLQNIWLLIANWNNMVNIHQMIVRQTMSNGFFNHWLKIFALVFPLDKYLNLVWWFVLNLNVIQCLKRSASLKLLFQIHFHANFLSCVYFLCWFHFMDGQVDLFFVNILWTERERESERKGDRERAKEREAASKS